MQRRRGGRHAADEQRALEGRTARRGRRARRRTARRGRSRRAGGRACCRASGRRAPCLRRRASRASPSSAVFVLVAAGRNDRVDEHLDLAPEPCAVALEPDRLLEREQLVEACPLLGRRHVVGELRRRRPGSHGVRGREHLVVADGLEEAERRLELLAGLAAEPDDHVGRDRDPGHGGADRARAARGSARSCTGGPSGAARRRRPTGPAGGGARTPTGSPRGPRQAVRQVPRVRGDEAQPRDRRPAVGAAQRRRSRGSARRGRAARGGRACDRPSARRRRGRSAARARRSWP